MTMVTSLGTPNDRKPIPILPAILLTILLVISTLSGCALYEPRIPLHKVEIPSTYAEPQTAALEIGENDPWWLAFEDETLNSLMDAAFTGNLDLASAYARLSLAEAMTRKSRSALLPSLDFSGSTERASRLGGSDTITGTAHSLSLAAGYEVDLWNRLGATVTSGELTEASTLSDIRTLYLSTSAEVADLYYLMVEQRAQLILTDRTIEARKDTVELVEQRFREGMVPALDLYQARQNLSSARSRRPDFEARLATTAHALSILTGRYPDRTIGGELSLLPTLFDSFPSGLPSELLKRRPDIFAALQRLAAADQEIGAATADRFPSINLLAGFGPSGSDFGGSLSGVAWNFAANLALPLFDGGRRKAEVDRNIAVYEEILAGYRKRVLTAFAEVEDALVGNRTTAERIHRLENEEKEASHALRLSRDRYFDGLSDYLPVLTAQSLHYDIRSRLLSARRELTANRISLARAMGGSWMEPEVEKRLR